MFSQYDIRLHPSVFDMYIDCCARLHPALYRYSKPVDLRVEDCEPRVACELSMFIITTHIIIIYRGSIHVYNCHDGCYQDDLIVLCTHIWKNPELFQGGVQSGAHDSLTDYLEFPLNETTCRVLKSIPRSERPLGQAGPTLLVYPDMGHASIDHGIGHAVVN